MCENTIPPPQTEDLSQALYLPGKHCTTEQNPQPQKSVKLF